MATLHNTSSRPARWRTFNQGSLGTLIAAAEIDVPANGITNYLHAQGAFNAEVREPELVTTPLTPVLAAVTGLFTNTDTLVFNGSGIVRATAPLPVQRRTAFVPSRHGFGFSNSFPRNTPHFTLDIAGQTRGVFDAGMGLCGGMVYAALDYLATGARPGNTVPPATGPLFDFLCRRLVDSFGGPGGVARYLHLMHPSRTPQERARTMIVDEWPAIRASLDAGRPVPLALVLVESADPFLLGRNHQVLAHGYDLTGSALSLCLYDPNHPGRDDLRLTLDIGSVQVPANARLTLDGCAVRAFFRTVYQAVTPPPAAQVPVSSLPARRPLALGGTGWVEGNGHVGLIQLSPPQAQGNFNGTLYGNALQGRWNGDELEFVRTISPGYDQVWSGRRRDDGSLVGRFVERRDNLIQRGQYSWGAHSALLLDGNGWLGELALDNLFGNGDFAGRAYGAAVRGRWDASTQRLSFTRELGPGYQQLWTATRGFGLDFTGEFQERQQGVLQTPRYRWLARLRSAARDTVCVLNHTGQAAAVRCFAPDDRARAAALLSFTVAAGGMQAFDIPLGLPLALTHVALVFGNGQEMAAGFGDDVVLRADGSLMLA